MAIIWCMVPEVWKFWKNKNNAPIYYHFTHVHHKWQSYDVHSWDMRHDGHKFVVILGHLYPTEQPENFEKKNKKKKKKKKKKPSGDIIILHKCMKNYNHMLHCSWDITCGECNFYFSFGLFFCPFTALQIFLKMKKTHGDIIILHKCTKNYYPIYFENKEVPNWGMEK